MLNFLMKKILTINIAEKDIEFFFRGTRCGNFLLRKKMLKVFFAEKDVKRSAAEEIFRKSD